MLVLTEYAYSYKLKLNSSDTKIKWLFTQGAERMKYTLNLDLPIFSQEFFKTFKASEIVLSLSNVSKCAKCLKISQNKS